MCRVAVEANVASGSISASCAAIWPLNPKNILLALPGISLLSPWRLEAHQKRFHLTLLALPWRSDASIRLRQRKAPSNSSDPVLRRDILKNNF